MRIYVFLAVFAALLFGGDIKPHKSVSLDSPAIDISYNSKALYISTSKGDILEIDKNKKPKKIASLPQIPSQLGGMRHQKAFTLDVSKSGSVLYVGGEDGYLYTIGGGAFKKTQFKTQAVIKKVSAISDTTVLIGLVSSQVILYDTAKNKKIYEIQVSTSTFGDMATSEDGKTAAIATEAGAIHMLDVQSGKIKTVYKNVNLDNIYKTDYKNKTIITAGQDRKSTVMTDGGAIKAKFDGEFLIYAVALSPSGARGAVAVNEQNDIAVFDIPSKTKIAVAKGHTATLNKILFLNENEFVSAADENKIIFWSVK